MLEINNVLCHHHHYSFKADYRERWRLLGPTGFGKTTFFHMLAGLKSITQGDLLWHGESIKDQPIKDRPISYLLQDCQVYPHLTVLRQLKMTQRYSWALEMSEAFLPGRKNQLGEELSGGEKHSLGLIRVLAEERPIIILDEPFAGMDDALKKRWITHLLFHQFEKPCVILFTSHDDRDEEAFATHTFQAMG